MLLNMAPTGSRVWGHQYICGVSKNTTCAAGSSFTVQIHITYMVFRNRLCKSMFSSRKLTFYVPVRYKYGTRIWLSLCLQMPWDLRWDYVCFLQSRVYLTGYQWFCILPDDVNHNGRRHHEKYRGISNANWFSQKDISIYLFSWYTRWRFPW